MYLCYTCGQSKEKSEFPVAKDKRNGIRTCCKACTRDQARILHNLRNYNLTQVRLEELLVEQNNACKICLRSFDKIRRVVDHDHKTGLVRGLLCNSCNTGLGKFADDPTSLQRASEYLKGTL